MNERDWLKLIDRRRAAREGQPSLAKVLPERPGSVEDRQNRVFYAAQSQMSIARAARTREDRRKRDLADADEFIAVMEEKRRAAFLAHLAEKRMSA